MISARKPLGPDHGGELGTQHLHGDLAIVADVVREIDRGHPAGAELPLDRVAVAEGGGEAGERLDH